MDNVTEIVKLAETRLKEAKVLFDHQLYDGCIYLAGYSVELMLKAKIAQLLDLDDLFVNYENRVTRSFKVHRLQDLAMYAGLHNDISSGNNGTFDSYWSFIITEQGYSNKTGLKAFFEKVERTKETTICSVYQALVI